MGGYIFSRFLIFVMELIFFILFLGGIAIFLLPQLDYRIFQNLVGGFVRDSAEMYQIAVWGSRSIGFTFFLIGIIGIITSQLTKAAVDTAHHTKLILKAEEANGRELRTLIAKLSDPQSGSDSGRNAAQLVATRNDRP